MNVLHGPGEVAKIGFELRGRVSSREIRLRYDCMRPADIDFIAEVESDPTNRDSQSGQTHKKPFPHSGRSLRERRVWRVSKRPAKRNGAYAPRRERMCRN